MSPKKGSKKKYAQKLPSLANHHIHNIPINLMESIPPAHQAIASSASPTTPSSMMPYGHIPQMHNPMVPYHPAYFMNPLSYYWPLYGGHNGHPSYSNMIHPPVDLSTMHEAATMIQKTYRGYLVRREFISMFYNPIIKVKNPPLYLAESLIYETIKDFIIESLVELCQTEYYPISRSRQLQAPNMLYHILDQMIHETAFNTLNEAKLKRKGIVVTEKWESAEQLFLLEELNSFVKDVLLEAINSRVKASMLDMNADIAFSILHDEIVRDDIMTLLYDVIIEFVYDGIVHEIIRKNVFQIAPALCKSAKVSLTLDRPSKKKSKRIDRQMDEILDEIIIEELALALSSPPVNDELDNEINSAIVNSLIQRL